MNRPSHARSTTGLWLALAALVGACLLGLGVGAEPIRIVEALTAPQSVEGRILYEVRLPRLLLGALVGAALAPSGAALQALLRNPLAEPYVLGVAGGAAAAGTLTLTVGQLVGADGLGALLGEWLRPLACLGGALISLLAVFRLGRVRGRLVPEVAILAGVVLNGLAGALVLLLRLIAAPGSAQQALFWLSGALRSPSLAQLGLLALFVAVGLIALLRLAVPLNALALGEESAAVLGIDPERAARAVFVSTSLLTGAAVAFAGPIGFIGILAPHALRSVVGPDHRRLLPLLALGGAALLITVDSAARLSLRLLGTELPVGLLTALLGAPLFLVLLGRRQREAP